MRFLRRKVRAAALLPAALAGVAAVAVAERARDPRIAGVLAAVYVGLTALAVRLDAGRRPESGPARGAASGNLDGVDRDGIRGGRS